ncbi:MAG: hypothetical protein AMS25_14430 [Gemmatimonas sp. SM23_52]|jgi:uncharacterized membrane protein|nr:MAG: hypothetical protein AMS25_14430 [Gemmatimonas sp. SM23_52]
MRVAGIWIFLHVLGTAFWLGGVFVLSIWTARARGTGETQITAFAYSTARQLYRGLVLTAATLTIVAGAILMIVTQRPWFRPFPEHWLFQMQVIGFIAFLVTLIYVIPKAGALARLAERGDVESPEFRAALKRGAIVGSAVGALLIYLVLLGALRF